jgi:nucleotide-binding universal stress UspA family protein
LIVGVPKPPVGGRAWLRGPVRDLLRSPAGPLLLVPVPVSVAVTSTTRTSGPLAPRRPAAKRVIVDWHTAHDSRAGLAWAVARIEAEAPADELPELILTRVYVPERGESESAREMLAASTEVALQTESLAEEHPDVAVRGETMRVGRYEDIAGLASAGDLIVVTAPTAQAVSRVRLRDVAEEASGSVVIVPASWAPGGDAGEGIVVGVDDGEPSAAALRFALAEGERQGEPVTAVHAWLRPPIWKGATMSAEALTAALTKEQTDLLESWVVNAVGAEAAARIGRRIVEGHAAARLVGEARGARLLVVGTHGRHAAARLVLGSVSASVVEHPAVPTIVVHA